MNTKTLYITLALAIVFFAYSYFAPQENKPVFSHSYAKSITPYQADTFDYSDVNHVSEKKQIFFDTLRPIVENQNQIIRDTRQHVLFARQYETDYEWVESIAKKYKVEWNPEDPDWDTLLFRIDTIPVELVMTQAANESAWGTSRFAQKGNNLFGQWCFSAGCGIVPEQRDSGSSHEVKKFDNINQSVSSYMHNINTTRAYKGLRKVRLQHRKQNKPLDAISLATGLEKYSTRGKEYVKEIQSMIKTNLAYMQGLKQEKKDD